MEQGQRELRPAAGGEPMPVAARIAVAIAVVAVAVVASGTIVGWPSLPAPPARTVAAVRVPEGVPLADDALVHRVATDLSSNADSNLLASLLGVDKEHVSLMDRLYDEARWTSGEYSAVRRLCHTLRKKEGDVPMRDGASAESIALTMHIVKRHLFEGMRAEVADIQLADPANPDGNRIVTLSVEGDWYPRMEVLALRDRVREWRGSGESPIPEEKDREAILANEHGMLVAEISRQFDEGTLTADRAKERYREGLRDMPEGRAEAMLRAEGTVPDAGRSGLTAPRPLEEEDLDVLIDIRGEMLRASLAGDEEALARAEDDAKLVGECITIDMRSDRLGELQPGDEPGPRAVSLEYAPDGNGGWRLLPRIAGDALANHVLGITGDPADVLLKPEGD